MLRQTGNAPQSRTNGARIEGRQMLIVPLKNLCMINYFNPIRKWSSLDPLHQIGRLLVSQDKYCPDPGRMF